jgi:membrane associated rhomboid family serine protease
MKRISDKINIVFKPFLIALIGLTTCYTFIHWLLFIKLNLFSLKEIITNFGIPIVLTGIVAWFLLRPKFKVLNLEAKRGNWRDFYSFILWVALTIPLIIAQEYLITATGKLTNLKSINEINNSEPTKYYALKKYYIDKVDYGVHSVFDVSGKHNESFNMNIYIALPIFESEKDTVNQKPFAWLGTEYNKTISNRLEPNEKEAKYKEFANESQKDFDNKNVSQFIYLDRIGNSDDKIGYIEAIKQNTKYEPNEIILVGKNEPFELRNGKKLEWFLGSALIGSLVWLLMILIPKIDERELIRIKAGKPDKVAQKEMLEFIDFLKPKEGYYITPIVIYLNIGIFLAMVICGLGFISFKGQDLLNWGANFRPMTTDGQWWRLLTNTFLHGGLMHLLANMYGLLFVGIFLEPLLGKTKYLLVYLTTGILASVASIWWYEATISVGASGAIFGLYGFFLATLLLKVFPPEFGKAFLTSTLIFVGFNLLMGFTGGIDNSAHIGGLLTGFILGLIMSRQLKQQIEQTEENEIIETEK